ncbi:MAG: sigma-70 family RNA polymerase sigma factor [Dehalococcoidia bacterium]
MSARTLPSSEAGLLRLACLGDETAFGELYNRYFRSIYDFLLRTVRDSEEAADLTQETFLRAMQNITSLRKPERFKSWLFAIAHDQAISRLERQQRIAPPTTSDDAEASDPLLRQVDADRLANPEQALEAQALAALVWQAAEGLDRRQYALLDLHVRQGLESAEIAEVLGVSRGNASTMINRMKKAVEEAIGAFVLARRGSNHCGELQAIVAPTSIPPVTPALRKAIDRHVSRCEICDRTRKRLLSPIEILGAFAPLPIPLGLHGDIWNSLAGAWPEHGPDSSTNGGGGPPTMTAERLMDGLPAPGWRRWQVWAIAAMLVLAVLVPIIVASAIFIGGGSGSEPPNALAGLTPQTTVATEEAMSTATDTPLPTSTPDTTATSTATPTWTPIAEPNVQPPPQQNNPPPPNNNNPPPPPPPPPPPDTTGPSIRNVHANPGDIWEDDDGACPSQAKTSQITAQVNDSSGVNSILIGWSVGLHIGQTTMSRATTLAFATIGPFDGDTLDPGTTAVANIVIRATDSRGNVSTAHTSLTLHDCSVQ